MSFRGIQLKKSDPNLYPSTDLKKYHMKRRCRSPALARKPTYQVVLRDSTWRVS